MFTFLCSLVVLILGYIFYGKRVAENFGFDDRKTPAFEMNDGVDYVPMPTWKVFLVQLLNIAGLGPIFGALNGALFGPVVYIWIVFGTIFAGAVHDYMVGMMSMRHNGASISELTGKYLGNVMLQVMRLFSVALLVMLGVIFSKGPAGLLAMLTPEKYGENFWFLLITIYYFIATFVPVDKVIGKIYPLFGICLVVMAIGVAGSIMFKQEYIMPELWSNLFNQHPQGIHIWPFMFVTVACGAISGFHATQSPMMARCCKSEREGQLVFYGAMVGEGIIALVWAAAGVSFYENTQALLAAGAGINAVVYEICSTTMGKVGGLLAMLGIIVCPVTSGDTAYRSARLTLADWFKVDQGKWKNRFVFSVLLLGTGTLISQVNYSTVWRYGAFTNQVLAMIALWTAAVYLEKNKRKSIFCLVPAVFMTGVTTTYLIVAPECFGFLVDTMGIRPSVYYLCAVVFGIVFSAICLLKFRKTSCKGL